MELFIVLLALGYGVIGGIVFEVLKRDSRVPYDTEYPAAFLWPMFLLLCVVMGLGKLFGILGSLIVGGTIRAYKRLTTPKTELPSARVHKERL